ncbi:MAG: ankyrin repeat domain-containing protein, partial [Janthinobacterium lividum]
AIAAGHTEIVKLLLEHGTSPNMRFDRMPLLAAAINNNREEEAFEKIGLLLDYGARVNARDADGWTA